MGNRRLTILLAASVLAGCSVLGGGPRPAAPAPVAAAAAASSPMQCVPEGQSCADKSARCCPGLTCTGIGKSVCLVAY